MKVIRKIADAIIYGNVFVSLCAYFLTLQNAYFEGKLALINYLSAFVFFSTLLIYNYRKFLYADKEIIPAWNKRSYWVSKHRSVLGCYCAIAIAGIAFCFFHLSKATIYYLLPCFVISLGYASNLIQVHQTKKMLRQIPYLKIFLVAGVWSFVTTILPEIEHNSMPQNFNKTLLQFTERFLFIFSITLPFDIRDMEIDQKNDIKTIPLRLGEQRSIYLSIALLIGVIIFQIMSIQFFDQVNYPIVIGSICNALFSIWMVSKASSKSSDYFVSFKVEGLMLSQFLLIFLVHRLAQYL